MPTFCQYCLIDATISDKYRESDDNAGKWLAIINTISDKCWECDDNAGTHELHPKHTNTNISDRQRVFTIKKVIFHTVFSLTASVMAEHKIQVTIHT